MLCNLRHRCFTGNTPKRNFLDPQLGQLRVSRLHNLCDVNDFHSLKKELYIPSITLDTDKRVVFGHRMTDDKFAQVPICKAITASAAIPFFFEPVVIEGEEFIDAETDKIAHVDIAINEGAKFIVLINPIVPVLNDKKRGCIPTLIKVSVDLLVIRDWRRSTRNRIGSSITLGCNWD